MSSQVNVEQGILQGKESRTFYGKKYYSFEGIPYAKPPVGKLRFRNPEEPEPWKGTRDATKPGSKCAQLNPYSNTTIEGSEDCLYLNVYSPTLPEEKIRKLPVIFFIHGGRLIFGHGHYYTPDFMIKHDVILVTINYRLNVLGFLCLHTPEAPGNAGLKDAALALKWVNRNICSFNGDPQNVTVFGESAGAAIATSFLTSKMTMGLYNKIIAQSGNILSDLCIIEEDQMEKARNVAINLGKDLNDKKSLSEFLVETPVEDLIYAFSSLELSRPRSVLNAYFLPVVEKKFEGVDSFFEEPPLISIRENRFQKVPILTGVNSYEGALFLQTDEEGNIKYETDFNYFIPKYLFIKYNSPKAKMIITKLRSFYFKDQPLNDAMKSQYLTMISDALFLRDIMVFAEIYSKYGNDVYVYKFNFNGNLNTRVMKNLGMKGTSHGDMIQYQFYRKNKADKSSHKDNEIINFLTETWCNFVKNGKPTWSNQTLQWLPYSPAGRYSLLIDEEMTLPKDLDWDRLKFWLDVTKERSKL